MGNSDFLTPDDLTGDTRYQRLHQKGWAYGEMCKAVKHRRVEAHAVQDHDFEVRVR